MTIFALLLLGCQPEPGSEPYVPDLPTGGCGLAPYSWVDTEGMGEIVAWEYVDDLSYSAQTIQALLEAGGVDALSPVPWGVRTYRVRYVTQDRGTKVEATGWLAFPDVDEPTPFPSALWLHGSTGFSDACAPTAMGFQGAASAVVVASQGFAAAAPDYLGMAGWGDPSGQPHPLAVPEPTAVASLDSIRALWGFADHVLDPANHAAAERRLVTWGVSEGGFAAFWADRYAADYLPEAEVVAGVAAVAPTDFLGLAEGGTTSLGPLSEQVAAVLVTNHHWYRGAQALTEVLTPALATTLPEVLASECGDAGWFEGVTALEDAFTPSFLAAASSGAVEGLDPWGCYLAKASLHRSEIERRRGAPLLFVLAEEDDIVLPDVERADFLRLCEEGYHLDYVECAGASHSDGAALPVPYELQWLRDRLAEEPLPDDTCTLREPVDCATLGLAE